jgi:hypothetical protein
MSEQGQKNAEKAIGRLIQKLGREKVDSWSRAEFVHQVNLEIAQGLIDVYHKEIASKGGKALAGTPAAKAKASKAAKARWAKAKRKKQKKKTK